MEKRRQQKRESEQIRQDKIRNNPQLYEEAKKKERERYHKRKENKKIKLISEMSDRQKRIIRRQWKKSSQSYRNKLKLIRTENQFLTEFTPPGTPTQNIRDLGDENNMNIANTPPSGRSLAGRKRVLRKRSATVRKLKAIEKELMKAKTKTARYKTKYYRLKRRYAHEKKHSPVSKVKELTKGQIVNKEIKQHLVLGEVLKTQLHENFKKLGNSTKKKQLIVYEIYDWNPF